MGRCQYFKICNCADEESMTCTKMDGDYYGPGRMAGCGRDLTDKGSKSIYHISKPNPRLVAEKIEKKKSKNNSKKSKNKK
jgi:hypothetical protein